MADHVADDEVLLRRVPPRPPWVKDGRPSSANFKLDERQAELGLSVYRQRIVDAQAVLSKPDAIPASFLVAATAGTIRALCDGTGKPLELDVIVVDDEDDPGHAEIRGPELGKLSKSASRALQKAFALYDPPADRSARSPA